MSRVRTRPTRAETRERLFEAAAEVFQERGIGAASIDAIAEAAGLTRGAFYSNFANKDELIAAMLADHVDRSVRHHRELLERLGATTWTIDDGILSADGRLPRPEDTADADLRGWGVPAGTVPPPPALTAPGVAQQQGQGRGDQNGQGRGRNVPEVQRGKKGKLHSTLGMTATILDRPAIEEAAETKRKKKVSRDRSSEGRR